MFKLTDTIVSVKLTDTIPTFYVQNEECLVQLNLDLPENHPKKIMA